MSRHQAFISPGGELPALPEYVVVILFCCSVKGKNENIDQHAAQDRALFEKASEVRCELPTAIAQVMFLGLFSHHSHFLQTVFP